MTGVVSRKEEVATHLRESILSGRMAPGDIVNEVARARALGVSVTPVREALFELGAEGLIVRQPNRRARVAELTVAEVLDILDAVALLLIGVIHRASKSLTPEIASRVGQSMRECATAMRTGERHVSDAALGQAVVELMAASPNGTLNNLLRSFMASTVTRLRPVSFEPVTEIWASTFDNVAALLEAGKTDQATGVLEGGFAECIEAFRSHGIRLSPSGAGEADTH